MNNRDGTMPTRSELRAALFAGAQEACARQSRGQLPVPVAPSPLYAPLGLERARGIVTGYKDSEGIQIKESFGSMCARAGRDDVVGQMLAATPEARQRYQQQRDSECPCCVAYGAIRAKAHFWRLKHKHYVGTTAEFDFQNMVTTIRSTLLISSKTRPTADQVNGLMANLAHQFDPRGWSTNARESFAASTPINYQDVGFGWKGQLYELFEWSWNPEATMSVENHLNVDYDVSESGIFSRYSLAECLSTKLWLSRQPGGLDLDRGFCNIQILNRSEILPLTQEEKDEQLKHKGSNLLFFSPNAWDLGPKRYKGTDTYNISVQAKKQLRFTRAGGHAGLAWVDHQLPDPGDGQPLAEPGGGAGRLDRHPQFGRADQEPVRAGCRAERKMVRASGQRRSADRHGRVLMSEEAKPKVVGGFPGFKMINAWAQLWTERVGGQGEALNKLWDHLRNKDGYSVDAWFKDVARFWDRTYNMMEDLWFFPVREGQEDRPTWVSLVWDGKGDTVTATNVRLTGGRVDEDRDPEPTDLEMLGADSPPWWGPALPWSGGSARSKSKPPWTATVPTCRSRSPSTATRRPAAATTWAS